MRKTGIATAALIKRLGVEETFRLLGECGFDFVDFSCGALDGSLPGAEKKEDALSDASDRPFEQIIPLLGPLKEAAARYGIGFGQARAPFPLYRPGHEANGACLNATLDKCVAMCGFLGVPYLVIPPAIAENPKEEWRVNMEMYKRLVPTLRENSVVCCLENLVLSKGGKVYEAVCADPYEACDYIDELNDYAGEKRFAFCYDTGCALLTGRDVYSSVMKLGGRVEALHIHDNDGRRDQRFAPYMGALDWERFVLGLRDAGYTGSLSFDPSGALEAFDGELTRELLRLIAATGRMFARRIDG